jgi:hypothetical protein
MRLGDFYLGMPISEIRDLVSRSIYRLSDSSSTGIQTLFNDQYPKIFTVIANKLDSVPCLESGNTFTGLSSCVFFDQVTIRFDDSTSGVYYIQWTTTRFSLDSIHSISRLQHFATETLQYLTRIFGDPHRIDVDVSMLTVRRLRQPLWSEPVPEEFLGGNVYLGKWEWRDEVDRYHMVIRGVYIQCTSFDDGTVGFYVSMIIPLLDDE